MKMKLLALLLLLTTTLFGQNGNNDSTPVISINGTYVVGSRDNNIIPEHPEANCGNHFRANVTINGNLNLNGNTLTIVNSDVIVTGSIVGVGHIVSACGDNNQSTLTVNGVLVPLPYGTLSVNEFNPLTDYGYPYKAYDLRGALIKEGVTSDTLFFDLPKSQILLIQVKGFKLFKINLL